MLENLKITMTESPGEHDWTAVKERALVTVGKRVKNPPDLDWKKKILRARHSPIRRLLFSFLHREYPLLGFGSPLQTHPRTALR